MSLTLISYPLTLRYIYLYGYVSLLRGYFQWRANQLTGFYMVATLVFNEPDCTQIILSLTCSLVSDKTLYTNIMHVP